MSREEFMNGETFTIDGSQDHYIFIDGSVWVNDRDDHIQNRHSERKVLLIQEYYFYLDMPLPGRSMRVTSYQRCQVVNFDL
jgi:hypothetical protein